MHPYDIIHNVINNLIHFSILGTFFELEEKNPSQMTTALVMERQQQKKKTKWSAYERRLNIRIERKNRLT